MTDIIWLVGIILAYPVFVIAWITADDYERIKQSRAYFKWLKDQPPQKCIYTIICEAAIAAHKEKSEVES